MKRVPVSYEIGATTFQGMLIYDAHEADESLPGIVMYPNWMGPSEASYEKAEKIADDDFAVFVADMYGTDIRPTNSSEAGDAAGIVRADRALMRERALKAVEVFNGLADAHPIDTSRTLAIGFCFGGGTVLEMARSGTNAVDGVVSFHGDLQSPTLDADAAQVRIPQLVLHGAEDPYVPQEDVQAFIAAMQAGGVDDWTLVQFSGTVHSFTDPTADSDGARYHKRSAERAFEMMDDFADEVLR
ncbi:MAG: dienelactone hydrolase family protein [Verrucomicrobia bacterium]|nr:dienelactone hydrolase family protein [Verrucomicrobiota bacterium]